MSDIYKIFIKKGESIMRDVTCTTSTMQTLCCISFLLVLSACASTSASNGVKDESSVFYAVPVGSLLVLNHDVTIPENQVAIYVQGGEIMRYREVNKYLPNCKFEVYKISEQARIVKADTFTISKVEDDIESSSWQSNVQLAVVNELSNGSLHRWGSLITVGILYQLCLKVVRCLIMQR